MAISKTPLYFVGSRANSPSPRLARNALWIAVPRKALQTAYLRVCASALLLAYPHEKDTHAPLEEGKVTIQVPSHTATCRMSRIARLNTREVEANLGTHPLSIAATAKAPSTADGIGLPASPGPTLRVHVACSAKARKRKGRPSGEKSALKFRIIPHISHG